MLDPLLKQAAAAMEKPVIAGRVRAESVARALMLELETLGKLMAAESDPRSQEQLAALCESLGVITIGLSLYARGLTPRIGQKKPDINLVVPS